MFFFYPAIYFEQRTFKLMNMKTGNSEHDTLARISNSSIKHSKSPLEHLSADDGRGGSQVPE